MLPGSPGVLCALHRQDSFLVLSPDSKGTRIAAYRWNGFGFDGINDSQTVASCHALLDDEK
jgi:poly-gamma-glutamate synthesis protein (capsule biosynthesis protein)